MKQNHRAAYLPRHLAVIILISVCAIFATNHTAARVAFDDGAGVILGVVCRASFTLAALALIVAWRRASLRLPADLIGWQILNGFLIALQSLALYSAIARIPVALALLINSLFPLLFALLSWALGGPRPSRQASILMGIILLGLVLVLDIPGLVIQGINPDAAWIEGIVFGFGSASSFAASLWVTEHKLPAMPGITRSFYTIAIVSLSMILAGLMDFVPGGMSLPESARGWLGLGVLSVFYMTGFCILFILMARLDMPRNAPVMNIEPVAGLVLGWLVLGQVFNNTQMLGGLVVLSCIVVLAYSKRR